MPPASALHAVRFSAFEAAAGNIDKPRRLHKVSPKRRQVNSPLYETALLQSGELSRKRERERKRRTPAAVPHSVLSIVIPRSHAIPDKTSLRVINLPGKLTSLEGMSTFQLVTTRYSTRYVLVGGYNRRINNLGKVSVSFSEFRYNWQS